MVVEDHAREFLRHIGFAGHFAGELVGQAARCRDGHPVKGDIHAAQFGGHGLGQVEILEGREVIDNLDFRIFAHMLFLSYRAALRTPTVVFSNTLTRPSSHSGSVSPCSAICSFTKADRLLALIVSVIISP